MSAMTSLAEPVIGHWDFPRSVAGVALLVRFGAEHGIGADRLLADSGIPAAALTDPVAEVAAAQELRVVRTLAELMPDAGPDLGGRYHVTTFGILGYAFISSPTVLDAVNVALRYLDLSFTFGIPRASLADDRVLIELDDAALPAPVARFLVERDLAAIHAVIGELLPGGVPLLGVDFRFPEPSDVTAHERVFGLRPRFGRPRTVASFDAAFLHRPLPQADPHTVAACEAQCRELVARRRARAGIAHEVRDLLSRPGAIGVGMDHVARELAISTRTLRRRLAESGTSFQELLDEVREALALELLTTLPVEDVALRLGYAEASSFIHAFKRWKGVTPAAHTRRT
jgi:AraC-like DNA-binding protein